MDVKQRVARVSLHQMRLVCSISSHFKIKDLGTGRVATPSGRSTHSRRTHTFNRICQVAPTDDGR